MRTAGGRGGATGWAAMTSKSRANLRRFGKHWPSRSPLGWPARWSGRCGPGKAQPPPNAPAHPNRTYKDGGWQGWGHWRGTGNQPNSTKKEQFLPFDEALLRVGARSLRRVSKNEWRLWCRTDARPTNMPSNPDQVYVHDGWVGWDAQAVPRRSRRSCDALRSTIWRQARG